MHCTVMSLALQTQFGEPFSKMVSSASSLVEMNISKLDLCLATIIIILASKTTEIHSTNARDGIFFTATTDSVITGKTCSSLSRQVEGPNLL